MPRVTVPYHLKADAGASGEEAIYTVPEGKVLRIDEVTVRFPPGTAGELELSLKRGEETVFPEERPLVGDGATLRFDVELLYESGEPVILAYRNVNTAEAREAYVYLSGVLV